MGEVLRLPRPRRYPVKWSAVRYRDYIEITMEWRTKDRAFCTTQLVQVSEWKAIRNQAYHFWALIEFLKDMAIERGARF
jgi:hypothetical protein